MLLALTRAVSPRLAECELTHLDRTPIDVSRAQAQHAAYEAALGELGCQVRRVEAAPQHPDSVFIEDTALVLDEVAVLMRPGAASRRGETAAVGEALAAWRPLLEICAPATLDGGDILRLGRGLRVGISRRSTPEGISQLGALLAPYGYTVEAVPLRGCLHLKSAVTAVAADTVLLNPAWVDPGHFPGLRHIEVAPGEDAAANALWLGESVIFPDEFPATAARLRDAGIRVRGVPAGELARAEGGVTCCSLLLETGETRL
jgi:dimethylargininase